MPLSQKPIHFQRKTENNVRRYFALKANLSTLFAWLTYADSHPYQITARSQMDRMHSSTIPPPINNHVPFGMRVCIFVCGDQKANGILVDSKQKTYIQINYRSIFDFGQSNAHLLTMPCRSNNIPLKAYMQLMKFRFVCAKKV